jgi:nucleoside-diphosphate-sugar epimerase
LTPLLLDAGHTVAGTTRSAARAETLRALGAEPILVDVFDAKALTEAACAFRPDVVIHQLTDLQHIHESSRVAEALARNARIRDEGTRNLVEAAIAAGARRLIAQSIAWMYAPGPEPHSEADPLDLDATGSRAVSMKGVAALENRTLNSPPLQAVVLRYGYIYGPGTGADRPAAAPSLHVDAAASAALRAVETTVSGVFNIAEPNAYVATERARAELGWDDDFRLAA